MQNSLGKLAFHIGFYIVFLSGIMLVFLQRHSAEFVITLFTFLMGSAFLVVVAVWIRISQR